MHLRNDLCGLITRFKSFPRNQERKGLPNGSPFLFQRWLQVRASFAGRADHLRASRAATNKCPSSAALYVVRPIDGSDPGSSRTRAACSESNLRYQVRPAPCHAAAQRDRVPTRLDVEKVYTAPAMTEELIAFSLI